MHENLFTNGGWGFVYIYKKSSEPVFERIIHLAYIDDYLSNFAVPKHVPHCSRYFSIS